MKWNLQNLYKSLDEWNEDFKKTEAWVSEISKYEGKLGNFESFKAYYELQKKISITLNKLFQYANLKSHLNMKNVENAARVQKVAHLLNEYNKATSFESPEILSLGKDKVFSFLERDEDLKAYRFPLEKLFHQSRHILDRKSEALLTNYQKLASQGYELHNALSVADKTAKEVTLKSGEKVTVTSGNYRTLLSELKDKDDRETVFKAVFNHYENHKHTYAQIYNTVLQADVAAMKARNYDSTLEAFLFKNKIDPIVYHNLVETAKESTHLIKRYYKLRKDALNLDEHRTFDRFMPLAESTSKFSYEEGQKLFYEAIDHLNEDFKNKAKDALKEGYVDVYEQDGKQTGAYSSSALDQHPFILMNYDDTLSDVFTLAHEAGHSMHSLFAMEHQPIPTQNYTIFVAEIASTFNEHLLLDYFIGNNKGTREDNIQLLQQSIDDILGTFYRQTLFAAYELKAHELAEKGEPITNETLSNIMVDLYKDFYDIDIRQEPGKENVWAYIPHFFMAPYYVYQYATSFAASLKLYDMVKENPDKIDDHINLLKSGGSDFPMNQVKEAGVDLTKKDAFLGVVKRLETLIDELELALKE